MFDVDELLSDPTGYRKKPKRQSLDALPYSPEEESSVLADLGAGAMSGLAFVGNQLDKFTGSRALRGLLGGKPRELVSIVPFSDSLGLTSRDDIVHGTDLIGAPKDTPLFSPEGALGFGLEAVLDPTLPFTGFLKGGLSAAGKGLKAAGGLEDVTRALGRASKASGKGFLGRRAASLNTVGEGLQALEPLAKTDIETRLSQHLATKGQTLADIVDQPMGGNLSYGIPFMEPLGVIGKKGGFGETVARGLDWAGDKLRFGEIPGTGYSPGTHLAQMLSGKSGGLGTKEFQQSYGGIYDALPAVQGKSMRPVHQLAEELIDTPHNQRSLMRETEGIDPASPLSQKFAPITSELNETMGEGWRQGSHKGPLEDWFAQYGVGRRGNFGPNYKGLDNADDITEQVFQTKSGTAMKRADALKNLTRGSDTLNDMLADPAVLGARDTDELTRHLQTHWSFQAPAHSQEQFEALADTIEAFKKSWDTDSLAYTGEPMPNFWRHPLEAAAEASISSPRRVKMHGAVMEALADGIKGSAGYAGPTAKLGDVLTMANIYHGTDAGLGGLGGLPEMARRLKLPDYTGSTAKELADWRRAIAETPVPAKFVDDVKRVKGMFDSPQEVNKLLDFYDSFTNVFKAGVLTWPARYARDFFSGQFNNMVTGQWSPWSVKAADTFVKGQPIEALDFPLVQQLLAKDGLPLTEENANKVLRAHLAAMGIIHPGKGTNAQVGQAAEKVGRTTIQGLVDAIPGRNPMGLGTSLAARQGGTLNPLDIKGVLGRTESTFAPVKVGEALGNYTDAMNRLPPYLELLKQGVDPKEAYQRVMAAQVDYSNRAFSPTERSVMTRVAPFYKFSRAMLPFIMGNLANEPSGRLAQIVRGQARTRDDEQFTPSHIAQTTAMPIPGAPQGFQRYLTSLGLMHEDPLNMLRPGQTAYKGVQGTLQELAGRLNPIAKMPLELAAGKQLFSGRDLQDLEGNLGRIGSNITGAEDPYDTPLLLEQALSNSPLSRLATTARTLTDRRKGPLNKGLNLLSGLRTSDVDVEKSKNIAIRENIEDVLRGQSGVKALRPHLYVKEEDKDKLTDHELKLLMLYEQLAKKQQKAARDKKKLTTAGK